MPDLPGAAHADASRPGSGEVTATVVVRAPVERVYAAFTSWHRQGEWIPRTQVRLRSGDGGAGSRVEAVTRVGPAVLRDEMIIDRLDPPYQVRVIHTGALLRGPGVMRCTPLNGGIRTQLVWHEWFQIPTGLAGRLTWSLLWPSSKASLTIALHRFARMVEAGTLP
jgi:uncharacterized protein YndB with AHSA1/START domain